MDKREKILLVLVLLAVLLPFLLYGGFALFLILADHAWYQSEDVDLGPIDYEIVLVKAEESGYDISGTRVQLEGVNAIEPGRVEAIEKRFGTAYLVDRVEVYYSENTYLEVCKYENPGIAITLWNYSHSDYSTPLEVSEFPDDPWMLEMFGLLFGLDEAGSREFLEKLKLEGEQQQGYASLRTNKSVDFPAVYAYLSQNSTSSTFKYGMWNDEVFYRHGKKIGYVAYLVPEASISTRHGFNKYVIELSSTGFARLNINMHMGSAGKTVPEDEYRSVFKEMFKNLGLPQEKVEELEFEYNPGVW